MERKNYIVTVRVGDPRYDARDSRYARIRKFPALLSEEERFDLGCDLEQSRVSGGILGFTILPANSGTTFKPSDILLEVARMTSAPKRKP